MLCTGRGLIIYKITGPIVSKKVGHTPNSGYFPAICDVDHCTG
jgi:hypothetical protein